MGRYHNSRQGRLEDMIMGMDSLGFLKLIWNMKESI